MFDFLKWLIVVDLLGWLVFPIADTLFPGFRDKGFTLSKILGLLIFGYFFWLMNIFELIGNNFRGVFFTLILIGVIAAWFYSRNLKKLISYIKSQNIIFIFYELLFLLSFLGFTLFRSLSPEIIGTEKPMELAFINGIFRSPNFPPSDPWLSDYSISYYYFGYLLVAMFMHFCGTASGIAFNLAISLWFSLITVASAGLIFNLLNSQNQKKLFSSLWISLIAPLILLFVSNAEGFLELIHARGIFWNSNNNGEMSSRFWEWLNIQELVNPPAVPLRWQPNRPGGNWWWRASRVLQDFDAKGNPRDIIDEFPFFSFFLGDFHPHLISMPFVLLVISKGLVIFKEKSFLLYTKVNLHNYEIWETGFICGSLLFINTWDFPIYVGLLVILIGIKIYFVENGTRIWVKNSLKFGLAIGVTSIVLYLPFLIGLSSQAGGFLPSLIFRTRGIHFFVMFFLQIFFISFFLISINKGHRIFLRVIRNLSLGLLVSFCVYLVSTLFISGYAGFVDLVYKISKISASNTNLNNFLWQNNFNQLLSIYGSQNLNELIKTSFLRLINDPSVIVLLCFWIALCFCFIGSLKLKTLLLEKPEVHKNQTFIVALIFIGVLLCYAPEFFYLRDQFGWRMNTIFKFYFQAWILFSYAVAYFLASQLHNSQSNKKKILFTGISLIVFLISFIYPCFALLERVRFSKFLPNNLNGNAFYFEAYPDEYEAINFLADVPYETIAEAVGGSYTNFGRISRLSGLPTVLGWIGHELQWRGGVEEIGSRQQDIEKLYQTNDWEIAESLISHYGIRYIYIGQLERSTYKVSQEKFDKNLELVFENSTISIYSSQNFLYTYEE